MKAWLIGGWIGSVIGILIGVFLSLSFFMGPGIAGGLLGGGGPRSWDLLWTIMTIMWTVPIAALFFGIGSFIGWIIRKIKFKK
jgi:hypothetical protein